MSGGKDGHLMPTESAESVDNEERSAYSIVVRTSSDEGSSTDGSVFIQLGDKDGSKTSKCRLNCSISHRKKFQRGHSDLFVLTEQNPLTDIKYVEVWLQRREEIVSWKLHSINVIEHNTNQLYRFRCGKWLGDENEKSVGHYVMLECVGEPFKVLKDDFFEVTR
uniref:PLAT domain-containing protein n=1 Tax=Panagrolaimus sp. JU765 TaxID=591449 RepID=A0AC34QP72_9BILA